MGNREGEEARDEWDSDWTFDNVRDYLDAYRESLLRPPLILPHGYVCIDTKPGAVNHWRPLGVASRPLKWLAAAEKDLT